MTDHDRPEPPSLLETGALVFTITVQWEESNAALIAELTSARITLEAEVG